MSDGEYIQWLESIVAKLPQTKDRMHVVPGVDRVWHPDACVLFEKLVALTINVDGRAYWCDAARGYKISDCYSTLEAAEKVRKESQNPA